MNRNKSGQKTGGFAMAMALVALFILLATGAGLLSIGMHSRVFAAKTSAEIMARCAADAGLTKAFVQISRQLSEGKLDKAALPYAKYEPLPYCDATFSYKVAVDSNNVYTLTATGFSAGTNKTVTAALRQRSPFDYAIFTKADLGLKSGTTIDWYNYDPSLGNLQVGTNSTAAGAITAKLGVTINGDVAVGPGGDPAVVINSKTEAAITGETFAMSEKQELPAVTVPAYLQSLPSGGSASGSITLSGGAVKYDSMYLGQGDTITVEGDVTLYVTGDIGLGNSSQVNISNTNPNASLTIYVGGGFSTKNGGMINNLTADPTKLQIYALDTCTQMSFCTAGTLYGAIYAPNAEVSMKNSVEIYGSIVSNQFFQAAASNVYYDPALRNVASDGVNTSLIMQQWSEP